MSFYVYETRYEGVNDVEVTDAERIEELTRNLKITNESWRRMHKANGVLREALKEIDNATVNPREYQPSYHTLNHIARTALDSPT